MGGYNGKDPKFGYKLASAMNKFGYNQVRVAEFKHSQFWKVLSLIWAISFDGKGRSLTLETTFRVRKESSIESKLFFPSRFFLLHYGPSRIDYET